MSVPRTVPSGGPAVNVGRARGEPGDPDVPSLVRQRPQATGEPGVVGRLVWLRRHLTGEWPDSPEIELHARA